MDIKKIGPGKNYPHGLNVVVEIPALSPPVKYEIEQNSGMVFVDRFINVPMFYPCNYGFIPDTLSEDGDPLDALILTPTPVQIGSVVPGRPVGGLEMSDEAGRDLKVLAVPALGLHSGYDQVATYEELPKGILDQIVHFFQNYKALEPGKWVKIKNWMGVEEICQALNECRERASGSPN